MTDSISATLPNSGAQLVHAAEQAQTDKQSTQATDTAEVSHRSVPPAQNSSVGTQVNTLA